jgi:hypothetical protein
MGPAFLLQIHLATGRLSKAPKEPAKASWLVTDAEIRKQEISNERTRFSRHSREAPALGFVFQKP